MGISKKEIRLEALKRRDSLTAEQRKAYSRRIIDRLTGLPCYQEADAILTYISFRSEVDTLPLLERAFADGKAVFAPKVCGKEMDFYRIFSVEDLTEGYQGILEPGNSLSFMRAKEEGKPGLQQNLICMPGAAFDRARHRIGYGGGFYDRYLCRLFREGKNAETAAWPQAAFTTAALAYDCQIFGEIPWEAHDICPERIVTETELF